MNRILLFVAVVALINTALFFATPDPLFAFSISDASLPSLFFYQFSHFDILHLIENLLGLIFTGALAIELDMKLEKYALAYFAGVYVAVPLLLFFPTASIAGNSTGIFGALAVILLQARKFIPTNISFPLAGIFIFSASLTSMASGALSTFTLKSDIFHLFGFLAGTVVGFTKRRIKIFSGTRG